MDLEPSHKSLRPIESWFSGEKYISWFIIGPVRKRVCYSRTIICVLFCHFTCALPACLCYYNICHKCQLGSFFFNLIVLFWFLTNNRNLISHTQIYLDLEMGRQKHRYWVWWQNAADTCPRCNCTNSEHSKFSGIILRYFNKDKRSLSLDRYEVVRYVSVSVFNLFFFI